MSTIVSPDFSTVVSDRERLEPGHQQNQSYWENLCGWLSQELRGLSITIERREHGADWVVECPSFPLERVTAHQTPNGVWEISIALRVNGIRRVFEMAGVNAVSLQRNAAGWPTRVNLGNEAEEVVLLISGELEPQKISSSNSWGE